MGLAALYNTCNCFTGFLILCISLHSALSAVVQDPFASKNPFGNVRVKSPIVGSTFFEVAGWPGGKPPGASTPNPTGLVPSPNGIPQPATGPPIPTLTAPVSPQPVSGPGRPQPAATPANPSANGWPASVPGTQQVATKSSNPYRPAWPLSGSPQPAANPPNPSFNGWSAAMSGTQQVAAKSSNPLRSGWPTSVPGRPQPVVKPKNPPSWPISGAGIPQPATKWSPTETVNPTQQSIPAVQRPTLPQPGRPTSVSGTPQLAVRSPNSSNNGLPASVSGTQQVAAKLSNRFRNVWPRLGTLQPAAKPSSQPLTGLPISVSGTSQPAAQWSPTSLASKTPNPSLQPVSGSPEPAVRPSNPNGWTQSVSGTPQQAAQPSKPNLSGWPKSLQPVSGSPEPAVRPSNPNGWTQSVSGTPQQAAQPSKPNLSGWPKSLQPVSGSPEPAVRPSNPNGWTQSVSGTPQQAAQPSKPNLSGWPKSLQQVSGSPEPAVRPSNPNGWTQSLSGTPQQAAQPSKPNLSGWPKSVSGTPQQTNGWPTSVPGTQQPVAKWSPIGSAPKTSNPSLTAPVSLLPVSGSPEPAAKPPNPNGWPQSVSGTPQQAVQQPSNPILSGWPTSAQLATGPNNLAPNGWPISVPGTQQPAAKWSPTGLATGTVNPSPTAPVSLQPVSGSLQPAARPPNPNRWPTSVPGSPQQAAQPSGPILTGWPTSVSGPPQQTAMSTNLSPRGWPSSVPGTQQPAAPAPPTGLVPETPNPTQQRIRAVPRPITKTNSGPSTNKSFRNVWAARLASRNPEKSSAVSNPTLKDGPQKQTPLVIATKILQSATSATSAPQVPQETKPLSAGWDIKATLSQLAQVTRKNAEQQQLRPSNSKSSSIPTPTKQATEPSQTTPQQASTEPNPASNNVIQSAINMVQKVQGTAAAQSSNAISTSSKASSVDAGTLEQLSSVISELKRYLENSLGILNNNTNETPNVNTQTSPSPSPSSQPIITETLNQPIIKNVIPSNGVNTGIPAPVTEVPNMFNPLTETPSASNLQPMPISMADVLRSKFMNPGLAMQLETGPVNNSPSNMPMERIAESAPTAPPTEVINTNQLPSNPNVLANMNLPPVSTSGSEPKATNPNALGDVLSIFSTSGNSPVTISESSFGTIPIATESPLMAVVQNNQATQEPLVTNAVPPTAANELASLAETPVNQAATEAARSQTQTGNTGSLMDRFAPAGASTNEAAVIPVTAVDKTTLVETPLNPAVIPAEMPLEQGGTQAGTSMNQDVANPAKPVDQTTFAETLLNQAQTSPAPTEMPMQPTGTVGQTTLAESPLNPAPTSLAPTEIPMESTGPVTAVDQTTLAESPLNPAPTSLAPTEIPMESTGTVTAVDQTTLAETPLNPAATSPTRTEIPMEPIGTVTAVDQTTLAETPLNPTATSLAPTEIPVGTESGPSAQQVAVNPSTPGQVMNPDQSLNTVTESVGNPSWQTNNVVNTNQIYPDPNTRSGPLRNEEMIVGNNPFETSNKIVLSPAAATIPGSPIAQTLNTGFAGQAAPETPISETANPSQGTMPNFSPAQLDALRSIMAAFPRLTPTDLLKGIGMIPPTSINQPQPAVAPPPPTMPPQSTSVVEPQPAATQSQTVYQPQSTVQPPIEGKTQQGVTVQVA